MSIMLPIVIADADVRTLESLTEIIHGCFNGSCNIYTAGSQADLQQLIRQWEPDLVFLDPGMCDRDGFSFLEHPEHTGLKTIFMSASNEFALQAIKLSALDYLLKPLQKEDVVRAIHKFQEEKKLTPAPASNYLQQVLSSFSGNTTPHLDTIALPTAQSIIYAKLNDILYIKAENNYSAFHLVNNEKILISYTLKTYEELLQKKHFMRVHNSFIVNLKKIKKILRGKLSHAVMEDGKAIEISPKRKEALLKALGTPTVI